MSQFKNNETETDETGEGRSLLWVNKTNIKWTTRDCREETVAVDMNGWISTCVVKKNFKNQKKKYASQKIKSRSVLTLDSKMSVLIRNNIYPPKSPSHCKLCSQVWAFSKHRT